jgi:hypothetical protein
MSSNFKISLFLIAVACFSSCRNEDENSDPAPDLCNNSADSRLTDIRDITILPAYEEVLTQLAELNTAFSAFSANTSEANLENVQSSLKIAWMSWQKASPFNFGPALDNELKSNVNTFPVDSFTVLQRLMNEDYTLIANPTKGFPAVDLLVNGIAGNNTDITALYSGADGSKFKTYLESVINDISDRIMTVKSEWEGQYGECFPKNTGFATGSSFSLFINDYIKDWEEIKRGRIALPLGLLTFLTPLPDRVECYYGEYSQELALEHTQSHYNIYLSDSYSGIQELVQDVTEFIGEDGQTLDEAIVAQFELAILKLSEVPDPLSETILDDFDTVNEAYLALQDMVVLLKTDMTSGLNILINYSDVDGD